MAPANEDTMSNKLTIIDPTGSVTEIELENLDEKIESIVAYRLRQRTRELEAAEKRVAELESQLTAQWRPVTEPPDKADWRSGFLVATVSEFVYYADEYSKGAWLWGDGWMKEIAGVTHWQPLPAPPQDTPASGRRQYNQDKS